MDTTYLDSLAPRGSNVYMVRALTLQLSGSGTYNNMSEGIFSSSTYSFRAGINGDQAVNNAIHIFPNPSSGLINIELYKIAEAGTQILINDLMGKELLKKDISGQDNLSLELQYLSSGVYFLTLKNKTGKIVEKLIRN